MHVAPYHLPLWRLILLLVLAMFFFACQEQPPPPSADSADKDVAPEPVTFDGRVVIYTVGPMSGLHAARGQAKAAGARLAAEALNRQGGLLKQEIIVKSLNDLGSPEGALAAAQDVANTAPTFAPVIGIVMHEGSDPQLESVKQTYLNTSTGLDPLVVLPVSLSPSPVSIADERFFRLTTTPLSQATEIVNVLKERGLRDTVVVHSATAYGQKLAKTFDQAANNLKIQTSASFAISPDVASYRQEVEQIRALKPAALFYAGDDVSASAFFSQLFGFEFQGSIFGSEQTLSYTVIDDLGCQAEGMNFASLLPAPDSIMDAEQLTRYAELAGRAAEPYTVAGYASVQFIAKAFQAAGALDARRAALQARQSTTPTLMGDLAFDAKGNVQNAKLHFFRIQGRQFKETFTRTVGEGPKEHLAEAKANVTLLQKSFAPRKKPLKFAGLAWDSAQLSTTIARFIIESGYDQPTHIVPGTSVGSFLSLQDGDIDIDMEVWLPNSQALYEKALANGQIVDLGINFDNAVQGWFVPKYVVSGDASRKIKASAPGLKSVEDLARYAKVFAHPAQPSLGRLMDGSPGWFSYKIDCMKLKAYRLDDKYAQIATGSEAALVETLSRAYEKGEPILFYLFEPNWPLAKYDLQQLEEPAFSQACWRENKRCAFPPSQVRIAAHKDVPQQAPEIVTFLNKFSMRAKEMNHLLLDKREQKIEIKEFALMWLKKNKSAWTRWVPSEVAQRVQKALK